MIVYTIATQPEAFSFLSGAQGALNKAPALIRFFTQDLLPFSTLKGVLLLSGRCLSLLSMYMLTSLSGPGKDAEVVDQPVRC